MNPPLTHQAAQTGDLPLPVREEAPPRRRGRSRAVRWLWATIGWLGLVPVFFVLTLRWQGTERPQLIAVVGMTSLLIAPLAGVAVASWFSRSPTLRTVTAATTVFFLATVSPVDAVVGCGAEHADDQITLYSQNVLAHGGSPAAIGAAIAAEDPDIVVLQEVRWDFLRVFREDAGLDDLGHRANAWPEAVETSGNVVWSRWPILDVSVERFVTSRLLHVTIDGPTGPFTTTSVHALAPATPRNVPTWLAQFEQLRAEQTATPRILAGDFNATMDHKPFRALLDSGWTDAHERKGCGFDATWPVDHRVPAPVLRLDHILVTDHFEVLDVRLGEPGGSDHLPVISSIRLTAPR